MSDTIDGRWRAYQTHPLPGLFNGEAPALQLRIAADDSAVLASLAHQRPGKGVLAGHDDSVAGLLACSSEAGKHRYRPVAHRQ